MCIANEQQIDCNMRHAALYGSVFALLWHALNCHLVGQRNRVRKSRVAPYSLALVLALCSLFPFSTLEAFNIFWGKNPLHKRNIIFWSATIFKANAAAIE